MLQARGLVGEDAVDTAVDEAAHRDEVRELEAVFFEEPLRVGAELVGENGDAAKGISNDCLIILTPDNPAAFNDCIFPFQLI